MRALLTLRWLPALALLAIGLVILAPLVSRAISTSPGSVQTAAGVGPRHTAGEQPPHSQHHAHHHDGHAPSRTDAGVAGAMHHSPPTGAVDPHAAHEPGVECDYCLIAARMIGLLVALLLALMAWPAVPRSVYRLPDAFGSVFLGSLGARGPPHLLAR